MRAWIIAAALLGAAPANAATVVIGVPDWPSAEVTAHVLSQLMEDQLGVETRLRPMGTTELIGAIDRGEVDIHPELWLPNLSHQVAEVSGPAGTLTLASIENVARQNLCTTPETVEATGIHAVSDLADPEIAAHFDTDGDGRGEMWIGDFDWSSTPIERARARSYGYADTMMLLTMAENVAMAGVDVAVATGRPVIFYCYSPHHVFQLHEIVRLAEPEHDPARWSVLTPEEDPAWLSKAEAGMAWPRSTYQLAYASELIDYAPKVVAFLEHVSIDAESAEEMSYAIDVERRDPAEVASAWIAEHEAVISEWVK